MAANELSSVTVSKTITVLQTLDFSAATITTGILHNDTFFPSSKTTYPGELKLFSVDLGGDCAECCIIVDFADGPLLQHYRLVYTNSCLWILVVTNSKMITCDQRSCLLLQPWTNLACFSTFSHFLSSKEVEKMLKRHHIDSYTTDFNMAG